MSRPEVAADAPLPISVVTVCKNNEETIGAVVESVRGWAGEIIALDSGSTDATKAILDTAGARVIDVDWQGHVKTKQAALVEARLGWVLHLDSDEPVLPDLARAIRELVTRDDPGVVAARVRRVVWYRGEPLQHAWQPEWRLRLVRRALVEDGRAKWGGFDPHDQLMVEPGSGKVIDLDGVLRHDSFRTFDEHLGAQLAHARTAAKSLGDRPDTRGSLWKLATSPAGAFLKQLVLKGAWRGRPRGLARRGHQRGGRPHEAHAADRARHGLNSPKLPPRPRRGPGGGPSGERGVRIRFGSGLSFHAEPGGSAVSEGPVASNRGRP
jgi:hypothetical protein